MAIQSIPSTPIPTADLARTASNGVARAQTPETKDVQGVDALQQSLPAAPPSEQQINQALNDVRNALKPVAQNLLFSLDSDTGKTVIKIVDASTDEVIKQIPSEEILAISKALDKLQGLLVKQEA
ncbi:flagellar protein FlaG [Cognatazoarcus halotolerans]|uniref:flagellar protein FlaG n=1 Tax=Cognatazoarcus halotolerans TaxID=2686016 RepID=UPI00135A21CB|nr:flagellar protein FlaG [Cognatazoarcus halotolerans]MCB1901976.1 flagellar protein FlaG [Rhodocyclaceae bacterium]MCP5310018.1 flagellar protein FlaG [Zoogloeaceae bacterium]